MSRAWQGRSTLNTDMPTNELGRARAGLYCLVTLWLPPVYPLTPVLTDFPVCTGKAEVCRCLPSGIRSPGASLVISQLSHLRGSAEIIWLLGKSTEEIHTSVRAVHILLGELEAGLLVSERLCQTALQAVSNRLLLGSGIWDEEAVLVRNVCFRGSKQTPQRPRALQGLQCKPRPSA